ncbi:MAG: alpha/beta fold hydrolase [Anaerolineaceae bacterium]|nr:alpha/beta fold hydrolase [Anaerolineaceae bacterium]
MVKRLMYLLLLFLVISLPVHAQDDTPSFEPGRCPFILPTGLTIDCGTVRVPADHRNPDNGELVSLQVAIIHSRSENPQPDPVVLLVGGPGGSALEYPDNTFRPNYYAFLENRDFILFDQRGVGRSEPSLDCPNFLFALYEIAGEQRPVEDYKQAESQALLTCRRQLVENGANLDLYNTTNNAADLEAIRQALGYEQWNLFGVSYGSKLALTVMRDYPNGIRSVILDSAYPLQVNLYLDFASLLGNAYRQLFDTCVAQQGCQTVYPDLETAFYELVDQFNREPARTIIPMQQGAEFTVYITGDMLVEGLFNLMYRKEVLPNIPQIIHALLNRDAQALSLIAQDYLDRPLGLSEAFYYSVQCAEEMQSASLDEALATGATLPQSLAGTFNRFTEDIFTLCAEWGVQPAPDRENQAVVSNIPALVLAGEFDPITPPVWGQMVSDDLANSHLYVFPGLGHGAVRSDTCPLQIALSFLDDPTGEPDSSCIATMPPMTFVVPETSFTLIPLSSEAYKLTSVIPDTWSEIRPGIYALSTASSTVLFQQSIPGGATAVRELLQQQMRLPGFPAGDGERAANGLTWTFYTLNTDTMTASLAITEQDGTGYLVMLLSPNAVTETYYNGVFLPVVDALRPAE